ncbi:phosphotransferase [Candidatus Uhrbacteria bacterium]|nr:phosphotransferase [Candidatus Uhrbacteria bacterium]
MKKEIIPKAVLAQYDLGKIKHLIPLTSGLIHKTFLLETHRGQYIMQELHPLLCSEGVGKDAVHVTTHLLAKGFRSSEIIKTRLGKIHARLGERAWRLQTKLPGKTFDRLTGVSMAAQAGEIFGAFHLAMADLKSPFHSTLVLHQTQKVYEKFLRTINAYASDSCAGAVKEEIHLLKKEMSHYLLPRTLPLRVIHGDPKISNILFIRGRAAAIIDLDTCSRMPVLVELGDAFRSWCGKQEDDPHNTFSLPLFKAAWQGYQKGAAGFLTKQERSLVVRAVGTIILELAARFLTDYFDDSYFGWDKKRYPSRRAHNLARCRGQLKEFVDYKKKIAQMKKVVG